MKRGPMSRREMLGLTAAAALAARPASGFSQGPARACEQLRGARISWLVGWPPGGGYDLYSRVLEPALERSLGSEVVVENVPGASGIVAARRIFAASPDGHTLGILNGAGLMIAPISNPDFAPDLERDFTVLGRFSDLEQALFVGERTGIATLEEFLAVGHSRPLVLGATGPTTVNALLDAVLPELFGVEVALILGFPTPQLLASMVRGDLDGAVMGEEAGAVVRGLRPLLRFSPGPMGGETPVSRAPRLPGANGLLQGSPGLFTDPARALADVEALSSLTKVGRLAAAPPGLPDDLRECLRAAFAEAIRDPTVVENARRAGRSVAPGTAEEVLQDVRVARAALPRFGRVLQERVRGARSVR